MLELTNEEMVLACQIPQCSPFHLSSLASIQGNRTYDILWKRSAYLGWLQNEVAYVDFCTEQLPLSFTSIPCCHITPRGWQGRADWGTLSLYNEWFTSLPSPYPPPKTPIPFPRMGRAWFAPMTTSLCKAWPSFLAFQGTTRKNIIGWGLVLVATFHLLLLPVGITRC